jgi:hypothetical protein
MAKSADQARAESAAKAAATAKAAAAKAAADKAAADKTAASKAAAAKAAADKAAEAKKTTTPQKATATPAESAAQIAVRKLGAGQQLTDAEKKLLGISVTTSTDTTVQQPTIYARGGRIDSAGNYVPYNPEMAAAGMTSSGQTPEEAKAIADAKAAEAKRIADEKAAADKAAADKIAADKAAADKAAADAAAEAARLAAEAAAKAEAERLAAEAKIAAAKTAKELADAKTALIAANQAAADAAAAAAAADKNNAALAAEAAAKLANANINVSGNTVLPAAGTTAADIAAKAANDAATKVAKDIETTAKINADKLLADEKAAADAAKMAQRQSTIATLTERFNKYNLNSLAQTIKNLAIDGANEATITLALQETPEYKERFKANELRMKKGLSVLDPGLYLRTEDSYRQVLREYGLKEFDTDAYVSKFIANDMSPTEFSNRIVTAVQRVQNADPALIAQLKEFYGITADRLVPYVLDPEQEFQKIERQIAAGEIGVAAARQGIKAGVSVADQLAAQGVTAGMAQQGYATIAGRLPAAEKLSQIYGGTMDKYGLDEAEQDVFNSLASAQRKRENLRQREIAAFSGSSGTNKTSLTTSSVGQY